MGWKARATLADLNPRTVQRIEVGDITICKVSAPRSDVEKHRAIHASSFHADAPAAYRSRRPWRCQKLCSDACEPLKTLRSSGRSMLPK